MTVVTFERTKDDKIMNESTTGIKFETKIKNEIRIKNETGIKFDTTNKRKNGGSDMQKLSAMKYIKTTNAGLRYWL